VFNWYENNLGPYRFGPKAGGVSVAWGAGALGGMEHHPYWHVASSAMGDEETHAHEAAHGWYGDGIRIACWEDFVLSEGTVTYLSARSLTAVGSPVGQQILDGLASELATDIPATDPVWPEGCNSIDIIDDNLFTRAPYVRGALFYDAVAGRVAGGVEALDLVLKKFYEEHQSTPARMADMLTMIREETGFDPTACANLWLRSTTKPTPGECP
jgi:aminopeptidase N